jgi:hypothetical protein
VATAVAGTATNANGDACGHDTGDDESVVAGPATTIDAWGGATSGVGKFGMMF